MSSLIVANSFSAKDIYRCLGPWIGLDWTNVDAIFSYMFYIQSIDSLRHLYYSPTTYLFRAVTMMYLYIHTYIPLLCVQVLRAIGFGGKELHLMTFLSST